MSTTTTRSVGAHRRTHTATSSSLREKYWEQHHTTDDDKDGEHDALASAHTPNTTSHSRPHHAPFGTRIRRTWAEMATQPTTGSRASPSMSLKLVILWGALSVVALLLGGSALLALVDISVDGLGTYASSSITGLASLLIGPENDIAPWTVEPATSFAPRTNPSAANAPYFLLDKQHPDWESERDLSWKQIGFWELARGPNRLDARKALEKEETCLTYEGRYGAYSNSTVDSVPLPPTAGAKTALLMHLYHKVFQPPMSPDMLRHLRAAITEVQLGSGIDVFLSIHLGHHASAAFREEVLQNVPVDLRGRVLAFDSQELFGRYVSDQGKIDKLIRVGGLPCENHYTASYFLDSAQGQQYSHMWWLESDVRQTGSWTSFFNHLNATVPVRRPPPKRWQRAYEGVFAEEWDPAVRGPWQPDYFATRFLDGSDTAGDWDGRGHQAKHIFGSDIAKAFIHMWGMSRRFHEVLTDYLIEGEVADSEYVLSSVAKKHGIPMWHSEPPIYRNGKVGNGYPTFGGYRPAGADPYYRAWHDNTTMCRPGPTLLHAVKAFKKVPGF